MSKSFNYLPDFILEGAIMYTDKGLYIAKAFDRELYIRVFDSLLIKK